MNDIYLCYLYGCKGEALPSSGSEVLPGQVRAPELLAHHLGYLEDGTPDGRATVEAKVAALNGTTVGVNLDDAVRYLKANPVPGSPAKHVEWLFAALQALAARPLPPQ